MEVAPDDTGRIYSSVTGLYLAVREGWLRWLGEDGEILPTGWELAQRERQRAEQEGQRAEQERERAEQERQRAEQERQRAEQERQRADRAEQLLETYRRRFGGLE